MELTDLQPLSEWMKLEKEITRQTGLDANVFNVKGSRITDYKNWANRLCPAIKDTDKGQSFICAVAHMNLATIAANTKKPVVEECDAGLLKMVVPIFVKDEFLGAVGACGMLMEDGEVDTFLVNKITEIDEEKVETLSPSVESISGDTLDELTRFVQEEIERIVKAYNE